MPLYTSGKSMVSVHDVNDYIELYNIVASPGIFVHDYIESEDLLYSAVEATWENHTKHLNNPLLAVILWNFPVVANEYIRNLYASVYLYIHNYGSNLAYLFTYIICLIYSKLMKELASIW